MGENTNRHTAGDIREFFMRLAEAIRQGKSDVQTLKRFILASISSHVVFNVYRNTNGKLTKEDRTTLLTHTEAAVPVPFNLKGTKQGFFESGEVYFAVLELYEDMRLTYPDSIADDAHMEVDSIIKNASKLAARDMGLQKTKSLQSTSITLGVSIDPEDFVNKVIGLYVKDGDWDYIEQVRDLFTQRISDAALATA